MSKLLKPHRLRLAASVALAALVLSMAPGPVLAQSAPSAPVAASVARVEARDVDVWDEFSGRLEAIERVEVRSRVSGAVERIHFREGALVKAGQLLVTIDPAPYAAEVDRLQAQVAAAEARVAFAASELERARQLSASPALSVRELDTRRHAHSEAIANLDGARAALEVARLNLSYTAVRAPVDGRVGRLLVTVGNLIAAGPGAPVLATLVSVDPIYASFDADEGVVARALAAIPVEAAAVADVGRFPLQISPAADGVWIDAQLQLIDNEVNSSTGTVRLRAVLANKSARLIPGQFVRVRMARPSSGPVIAISERAIGTDQDKKFVLVVGPDNKAAYREVRLGAMSGDLRIIDEGLKHNEQIVVSGLQRVKPGSQVAPEQVGMDGGGSARQAQVPSGSAQVARQ
jgi:multidrug efflux system membrane fusion protein